MSKFFSNTGLLFVMRGSILPVMKSIRIVYEIMRSETVNAKNPSTIMNKSLLKDRRMVFNFKYIKFCDWRKIL